MKLKQVVRYRLAFDRKTLTASSVLMGVAFFLQAVHFFGIENFAQVTVGEMILHLILPMVLEVSWFVLLRGVHLNAPGLYGILGTLFCLLLMVQTVISGAILGAIVAVFTLILAAIALLAVSGGYLNSRFAGVCAFLIALVLRCLFGGLTDKLLEIAVLCAIAGILVFFGGLENTETDT